MANQKRRVVYLSNEEWEDVRQRAERLGMTMSSYIRASLVGGHVTPLSMQRDEHFNSRPFRPVPKGK